MKLKRIIDYFKRSKKEKNANSSYIKLVRHYLKRIKLEEKEIHEYEKKISYCPITSLTYCLTFKKERLISAEKKIKENPYLAYKYSTFFNLNWPNIISYEKRDIHKPYRDKYFEREDNIFADSSLVQSELYDKKDEQTNSSLIKLNLDDPSISLKKKQEDKLKLVREYNKRKKPSLSRMYRVHPSRKSSNRTYKDITEEILKDIPEELIVSINRFENEDFEGMDDKAIENMNNYYSAYEEKIIDSISDQDAELLYFHPWIKKIVFNEYLSSFCSHFYNEDSDSTTKSIYKSYRASEKNTLIKSLMSAFHMDYNKHSFSKDELKDLRLNGYMCFLDDEGGKYKNFFSIFDGLSRSQYLELIRNLIKGVLTIEKIKRFYVGYIFNSLKEDKNGMDSNRRT